jgi:hypothetical protein
MGPVQENRNSSEYFRLLPEVEIKQELSQVQKGLAGMVFLISGKVGELEVDLKKENGEILEQQIIKNFEGNIRKTSYIKFDKELINYYDKLFVTLKCSGGYLLLGQEKNTDYPEKIVLTGNKTKDALYFRSVYNVTFTR